MTAPYSLAMYQGEDWSQQLTFYTDVGQTTPLVFTDPVMDIRTSRVRYATFDITGSGEGLFALPGAGVLLMTMPWQQTELIKAGTYQLDIFAEVNGQRRAISKAGALQLVVSPRITLDEHL